MSEMTTISPNMDEYNPYAHEFNMSLLEHARTMVQLQYHSLTETEKANFDKMFPSIDEYDIVILRNLYRISKTTIVNRLTKVKDV